MVDIFTRDLAVQKRVCAFFVCVCFFWCSFFFFSRQKLKGSVAQLKFNSFSITTAVAFQFQKNTLLKKKKRKRLNKIDALAGLLQAADYDHSISFFG